MRDEMEFDLITKLSLKEAQKLARHYNNIFKEGNDLIVFQEIMLAVFKSKKAKLKNEGKNGSWFILLGLHVISQIGRSLPIEKSTINIIHNTLTTLA
ncbi:hypothetical protein [Bartonella saheliensis]|uniref:hypothetical protein n=1 Tax=Bartonella saheliensis TaxID=1457016 RepID=UPI0011A76B6A